ncbi:MAG TPA: TetR/AcrR family transcriptional regulator [Pseudomonas sp.]
MSEKPVRRGRRNKSADVLSAACRQFSRRGFDGTNMDSVAASARVTKMTVYANFGSKSGLFAAALEELKRDMPAPEDLMRCAGRDLAEDLRGVAIRLLEVCLRSSTLGIYRMLIFPLESDPYLGRNFWRGTIEPYHEAMRRILREADRRGVLTIADPACASSLFFSLVIGEPTLRMLLGAECAMSRRARTAHVKVAVDLFMAGHGRSPRTVAR